MKEDIKKIKEEYKKVKPKLKKLRQLVRKYNCGGYVCRKCPIVELCGMFN